MSRNTIRLATAIGVVASLTGGGSRLAAEDVAARIALWTQEDNVTRFDRIEGRVPPPTEWR